MTDGDLGAVLLRLARDTIGQELGLGTAQHPPHAPLDAPGATFVTLMRQGELRGCIGTVSAFRSLREDVCANAVAAAFRDPRFLPLVDAEFLDVCVEVSLLDAPQPLSVVDERDALAQLRPHVDGVVLQCGRHRATFLPQVWHQLPHPADFLDALKRKAGLPARYWGDDVRLSRYEVRKFNSQAVIS